MAALDRGPLGGVSYRWTNPPPPPRAASIISAVRRRPVDQHAPPSARLGRTTGPRRPGPTALFAATAATAATTAQAVSRWTVLCRRPCGETSLRPLLDLGPLPATPPRGTARGYPSGVTPSPCSVRMRPAVSQSWRTIGPTAARSWSPAGYPAARYRLGYPFAATPSAPGAVRRRPAVSQLWRMIAPAAARSGFPRRLRVRGVAHGYTPRVTAATFWAVCMRTPASHGLGTLPVGPGECPAHRTRPSSGRGTGRVIRGQDGGRAHLERWGGGFGTRSNHRGTARRRVRPWATTGPPEAAAVRWTQGASVGEHAPGCRQPRPRRG